MYCIKCGSKNEDEAMFCSNCGSVISKKETEDKVIEQNNDGQVKNEEFEVKIDLEKKDTAQQVQTPVFETAESQVEAVKPQNTTDTVTNTSDIPVDLYRSPFANGSTGNVNTYKKKKFSATRFICSMIILIATVLSVVTIAFSYAKVDVSITSNGKTEETKNSSTGFNIIKSSNDFESFGFDKDDLDKLNDTVSTFRYFIITLAVLMLVFGIIDFVLLCAVRKRILYILPLIFSLIKVGIGGFAMYLWSINILGQLKDMFQNLMGNYIYELRDVEVIMELTPGIGMILAVVMQAIIFVCAIVLLCIRTQYRDVAQQSINA